MIILGIILLVIGLLVAKLAILETIGIILLVIGLILAILGHTSHAFYGRRHWF
jgi:membrane-bound ClpP family serine protease